MQFFEWLRYGTIALGVVVVIVAIVFLVLAVRGPKAGKGSRGFNISASVVTAVSLVIIVAVAYLTSANVYGGSINAVMTATSATEENTDTEDWKDLAYSIAEEGMVLLQNDNDTLPLSSGTKVNLLGYYAYNPIYSGSGSGSVGASDSYTIVSSLENAGIEVNPALESSGIYDAVVEDEGESIGWASAEFSIDEIPISDYTGDVSFENLKSYSDTAVVVIGRSGGEGDDLTGYKEGDYLALNDNETALLSAAQENFDTVIAIVDTANALPMGWAEEYGIDAVIWSGLPGPYGFEALGKIMTGEVNPSGHLPDTWVYNNNSNPTRENFGEQAASNAEGRYYVDYVEGIYVGYKWYETAYAEQAVITNTKTGETFDYGNDYDNIVAYPFGYGMSYTTFDQTISGGSLSDGTSLDATGDYSVDVTVTNTGNETGKSVVQLYVTVPYTDYDKENLVEKAEVSLVVFGKTGELAPGESETVTLEFSMEDIASYDSSYSNSDGTQGAYMLDDGEYKFSIRSDAHTELDSVTASLASQYFFSGDDKRETDEVVATNQFDEAARGEYLSRQDAFANYESAMASVSDAIEDPSYATTDNLYDESLDEGIGTMEAGVDYDVPGDLTLADMEGLDFDDPQWDELIKQMSIDDMLSLTGYTMYASAAVPSIGKEATTDSDGPLGISSMYSTDLITVAFPCVPLLSATFNTELAEEMGSCVADQAEANGITGWYAPAMDTHRSPYSGRNFEYYSEDATLGAYMAAAEVSGAREKGLITYIKHFFLNDQESQRTSVHTYSNEQAIREIYLKPFEKAVKNGGADGVMTSMNYVGDIYAGADLNLITNVLRGEWGFVGTVLTDMDEAGEIRSFWSTIRAGTDVWLGFAEASPTPSSDADIYYLQRACHDHLYALANGKMVAADILDWQLYRNIIYGELAVLAAACVIAMIIRNTRKKKKEA